MSSLSTAVLKLHNFRLLLLTRFFAILAMKAQFVIVGWQVYSITEDPFMLGLTGLTEAVPAITGALFAGHVVDNNKPRTTYLWALTALLFNTLFLLVVAGGIVALPENTVLICIFAGIFVSGMARCLIAPSAFTLLALIVPKKDMPGAAAWRSSFFQISSIIGPAIAGLIYGGYGVTAAWCMPMTMMCFAFATMWHLEAKGQRKKPRSERIKASKSIKEGWSFIWNKPILLSIMTLDMFAVLFGGAVAMLPAFAAEILHVGSQGLGLLHAAPAFGAITTALVLALRPMRMMAGTRLLWVVAGFGVAMIGFGLSTHFWVSMFFLALSGAFDSVSMVMRGTLMQLLTPDTMRGRVSSVNSMFIVSSNEIGAFESGVAARFLGLAPSVVLGGIGTILVVGVTAILSPQLRNMVVDAEDETTHKA